MVFELFGNRGGALHHRHFEGGVLLFGLLDAALDIADGLDVLVELVAVARPQAGFQARKIAFALGLRDKQVGQFGALIGALYRAFVETDASLIEINPLVVTKDGSVICLDAKMAFDDNALFRHPEIRELRDANEEDPAETEASKYDLSYVHLDGNIGCMVNGAGLAMATMDIVKYYGAEPANFLDVGGGANSQKVAAACT